MPHTPSPVVSSLLEPVQREGFCFATSDTMRPLLEAAGGLADWNAFADSWNRLEPDPYIAATGRSRRRRHATFSADANGVRAEAHQAHYQSLQYNTLQGNIQRWFEPIESSTAASQSLHTILAFCHRFFGALAPEQLLWHVELHQFRIEASADAAGEPTPEGSHRDGVDFVLVLLVDRRNIASGTTTVHDLDKRTLGSFTLTDPLDSALVDDARRYHGVTPVEPENPAQPAYRDVLVVTFRKKT